MAGINKWILQDLVKQMDGQMAMSVSEIVMELTVSLSTADTLLAHLRYISRFYPVALEIGAELVLKIVNDDMKEQSYTLTGLRGDKIKIQQQEQQLQECDLKDLRLMFVQ